MKGRLVKEVSEREGLKNTRGEKSEGEVNWECV